MPHQQFLSLGKEKTHKNPQSQRSEALPLLLLPSLASHHCPSVPHMAYHELGSNPHEAHPEEKPGAPASLAAESH